MKDRESSKRRHRRDRQSHHCVGARGQVDIPRAIDIKGKTILPGYVDIARTVTASEVHDHPQYLANLAFGVTTRAPKRKAPTSSHTRIRWHRG
jgi:imidazolonepropionase-like amidohydrolase